MATTVNVTSNFVGIDSKEIFLSVFQQTDTFSKGLITENYGIIGSYFLPAMSFSPEMRLATDCGWNPTGELTLADKEITVKKYDVSSELCKDKFVKNWQAQNQGLFSAHAEIPSSIEVAFMEMLTNKVANIIDNEIWNGTGTTHSFNGLLTQWAADSTVVDVIGATAINHTNVVAELFKTYDDVVGVGIQDEAETVFVVSSNVASAYKRSLSAQGTNTTNGDKDLDFMGIRLEVIKKYPANTIAVYRVNNVHFCSGVGTDLESAQVRDLDDLSGIVKYQFKYYAAVGYVDGSEIILYRG